MCGIAGLMTRPGFTPDAAMLEKFKTALRHRGPDGDGTAIKNNVALAQTRLAIIDVAGGKQPLFGAGTMLVANGEIYNYRELKQEFPDAVLATQSDSELPLLTYARDGKNFAASLRGMYAIALYDEKLGELFLTRDPFGIKPLYYCLTDWGVAFASEVQTLLAAGLVRRKLRDGAVNELLQRGYTTRGETVLADIHRVPPGDTLRLKDGQIVEHTKRDALPKIAPRKITEVDALIKLDRVLLDTVEMHQRSDVPYGMFLSGGVDSSTLLACMAKLNDRPVRTYTAGFAAASVADERAQARKVAAAVGANHIEIEVTAQDFWQHLPQIVAAMDDPTADYAIVPTYFLAKRAAQDVKVVLCGEGGDELFAGYGRYRRLLRPWWLGGRMPHAHGIMDGMGILRHEAKPWRLQPAVKNGWNSLQQAQASDCAGWLANDLLVKLDRCLMHWGLEGRTPFLDPIVADFAFTLPNQLKIKDGLGKYLLRRWLEKNFPVAEPFAKKRGFTVPVGEWLQPHLGRLGPLVAANAGITQFCNTERVRALFAAQAELPEKQRGMAVWQLLCFALWHRAHIEGKSPSGNVAATLAE
jgi:asparagine synthase (glutamine-hydrolysing)